MQQEDISVDNGKDYSLIKLPRKVTASGAEYNPWFLRHPERFDEITRGG